MIYVFKTSVKTKNAVKKLTPHLNTLLEKGKWNFDLEDCDKILRVESDKLTGLEIKEILKIHKFYCQELD